MPCSNGPRVSRRLSQLGVLCLGALIASAIAGCGDNVPASPNQRAKMPAGALDRGNPKSVLEHRAVPPKAKVPRRR
jgi:hypothetical protein